MGLGIFCNHLGRSGKAMGQWFDALFDSRTIRAIVVSVVGGYVLRSLFDKESGSSRRVNRLQVEADFPGVDKVWRLPLAPGLKGTQQTLAWMAYLVRRDSQSLYIRRFAENVVKSCPGHGFDCEVKTLFEFVRDQITYRRDPVGVERVQDARRTLLFGAGDCDDKSVLLATLLAALGHPSCFTVLGSAPGNYAHVFVTVQGPTGNVALDPTHERAPAGWQAQAPAIAHYQIFR